MSIHPATPRIYAAEPPTPAYDLEQRYYFESLMDDIELSYVHGASSGVRVTERTAMRTAAVFSCIRVIAESIAGIDLHLYRRLKGGGYEIFPGWLDTLLSVAPNPSQTRVEFLEQMIRHFEIWHRCYAEVVQGPGGTVTALMPLHPSKVKPKKLPNGRLAFIYTDATGVPRSFSQDEMFWMHGFSDDGETGDALLELGKETIGLCRALELHAARYFGNGARPGVVLETEQSLNPETVERLRESWERIHRGPQNAHKTAILDGGVKAHEFEGSSNQDSQFTQALEFETSRVCALFRVPPHKIQLLNRATFANVEQQEIDFLNSSIAPRCVRLEQAFARSLIADESQFFVRFDLNDLERGDSASRMAYLTAAVDRGILSVNEARAREGLNPVKGGDVHFFPLNMTTLEVMNEPVAAPPAAVQPVLDRLAAGGITSDAAKVLLAAQNPMLSAAQVAAIVDGSRASSQPDRAQVTALLQVIDDVANGILTPAGAVAVIGASFPQLDRAQVAAIVGGVRVGHAAPPPGLPAPPKTVDAEPQPPEDPAGDPLATAASGIDMAATALNGAQVTALVEVLMQAGAGAIAPEAAVAVITSSFPTISDDKAREMVAGAHRPPPADGVSDAQPAAPAGEGPATQTVSDTAGSVAKAADSASRARRRTKRRDADSPPR
jgi:HK97 family phage portal protein